LVYCSRKITLAKHIQHGGNFSGSKYVGYVRNTPNFGVTRPFWPNYWVSTLTLLASILFQSAQLTPKRIFRTYFRLTVA